MKKTDDAATQRMKAAHAKRMGWDEKENPSTPALPGVFNPEQKAPPLNGKPLDGPTGSWAVLPEVGTSATAPASDAANAIAALPRPAEWDVDKLVASVGGKLTAENVRGLIAQECDALKALLLEKNAAYGNSALDPVRLFSKASPVEQLLVRIDDKLSRISRGDFSKVKEEDLKVVTKDLLGYLILVRVAWRLGLE